MTQSIQANLLPITATLKDVLIMLNQGVFGIVLIIDAAGVLQGIFTDGDVRRSLLQGADLTDAAEDYMNRHFTAGSTALSRQENLQRLTETIRHLPILDGDRKPVDLISWAEIWRLPVMEPSLGGNELKYVSDCITSNWISSQGRYVSQFQQIFQDYLPVDFALCTSSGTTALHLALAALEIGEGDEVLVPDLTFAATANVVLHCGATPVLVDVDPETWTMDAQQVRAALSDRTKAMIPVHLYGHPCDMDALMAIAQESSIAVVEDCAEALGAEYKGRKVGTIGHIGCFSFFANKVITTGEGGMVTTHDAALYEKMMILRDHGMSKQQRYWHLYPGFNYRMTNVQAAIGLAQMERIDQFLDYRYQTVALYSQRLQNLPGLSLPPQSAWAKNIYWLYSILVDESLSGMSRDMLATRLADYGIETRPVFYPLHCQPPYQPFANDDYPVSDRLSSQGLSLPTANDLRLPDIERVCTAIQQIMGDTALIQTHLNDQSS